MNEIDIKPFFAWIFSASLGAIPRTDMDQIMHITTDILTIIALTLTIIYTIYRWRKHIKETDE